MEFSEVVRTRRMTRDFTGEPVERAVIERCLDLAVRSPSAGKTQGWRIVGLLGADTAAYWDAALPAASRSSFAFPGLLRAAFVGVVTVSPSAYVERYAEPDKERTGLGAGRAAWPVPYWTVDGAMATMTFLHALHDQGLGALFFAVAREDEVRSALGIPADVEVIGAVAAGHPTDGPVRRGASAARRGRSGAEAVTWGRWA